jgi:hypothetical protein
VHGSPWYRKGGKWWENSVQAGGNSSDQRRVKGLLTHFLLSVLSDCGFSPSSVKNKSLDEICGMYAYVTVYKGLLWYISVYRHDLLFSAIILCM